MSVTQSTTSDTFSVLCLVVLIYFHCPRLFLGTADVESGWTSDNWMVTVDFSTAMPVKNASLNTKYENVTMIGSEVHYTYELPLWNHIMDAPLTIVPICSRWRECPCCCSMFQGHISLESTLISRS